MSRYLWYLLIMLMFVFVMPINYVDVLYFSVKFKIILYKLAQLILWKKNDDIFKKKKIKVTCTPRQKNIVFNDAHQVTWKSFDFLWRLTK